MTKLQKYIPLCRITMDDGEIYYIPEAERDRFEEDARKSPFALFRFRDGESRRYKDVKKIAKCVAMGYEDLPKHQRTKIESMIKKYEESTGAYPKEGNIQVMIKRVLGGEV